jgi:hypothetical protein
MRESISNDTYRFASALAFGFTRASASLYQKSAFSYAT